MVFIAMRKYMPSILLNLYQRRLLDKNADITQEELAQVIVELDQKLAFLHYELDLLHDSQLMLKRLLKKEDLM